jgi:hypothetical protein
MIKFFKIKLKKSTRTQFEHFVAKFSLHFSENFLILFTSMICVCMTDVRN